MSGENGGNDNNNDEKIKSQAFALNEAMRILQHTVDNSLHYDGESVNLLRVGVGIGQAIELINRVYLELLSSKDNPTEIQNTEVQAIQEKEERNEND